jgi:hypothetical protein
MLGEAGEAACYALAIIEIAERVLGYNHDIIATLYRGIKQGYIHYNENDPNDDDNFFVTVPAAFLSMLTLKPWTVKKAGPGYVPSPGEYVVERWERVKTGTAIGHFRLPDWDSLHDSMTVRYGKIVSKRVFGRVR